MKMEKWLVYKHVSPSGKVYIGVTKNRPVKRWDNGRGYRTNRHFNNAIQKYGWENFQHYIIDYGLTEEEAVQKEVELIAFYDSANKEHGYNIALGGHLLSEESRNKIAQTRKDRKIPSPLKGRHHSAEARAKMSVAMTGLTWDKINRTISDAERKARRQSKLGARNPNYKKPLSEEQKQKLIDINSRPVIQITTDGCFVFKNAVEAGKHTGVASCNITRVCRGQRASAGGYAWRYAEKVSV